MTIVSGQSAAPLLKEAIVLDLGDLSRQAARIIAAAKAQADQILAQAQQQAQQQAKTLCEQAMAHAKEQGLADGLEEGRQRGHAEALAKTSEQLEAIQEAWQSAAEQWQANRDDLERQARRGVLELALALAKKVVHRAIEVDPNVVVAQVNAALGHVLRPLDVVAHICPQDRSALEEAMPQLTAAFEHLSSIRLKDDAEVARGGCVLRFDQGSIDAGIQTQLRRLAEVMLPEDGGAVTPAGSSQTQPEARPSTDLEANEGDQQPPLANP